MIDSALQQRLSEYTQGICKIYGNDLKSVILYGSCARGDNRKDSDIDIMILVALTEEQIHMSREKVSIYTYNFNMENDMEIVPAIKDVQHFRYWSKVHPFYQNIQKEGVELYAS